MCFGGIMSGVTSGASANPSLAEQINSQSPSEQQGVQVDPSNNAIREPTVDEVRKEWQGHVATLRDQIKGMADQRTQRLREIAIDTAIRNSNITNSGPSNGPGAIVAAAAVYYAFLDTGAVPA